MSDDTQLEIPAEVVTIDPETVASDQESFRQMLAKDPAILNEVRHHFELLQLDYLRRASEIERFLGFMVGEQDLGTRLHRLETFLGIKVS